LLIPKNIANLLDRQDISILYEIRQQIEYLISERTKYLLADELPKEREILNLKTVGSITYRQEKISCGKNCRGCPHGPYWYGYRREGGKTRSKYIGKSLSQRVKE
jgi:hypothetical protein